MIKAVFLDYTGTIITQSGKDVEELVHRVYKNSDMKDPNKFIKCWWGMVKEYEASFEGANYITEDEIDWGIENSWHGLLGLRLNHTDVHIPQAPA